MHFTGSEQRIQSRVGRASPVEIIECGPFWYVVEWPHDQAHAFDNVRSDPAGGFRSSEATVVDSSEPAFMSHLIPDFDMGDFGELFPSSDDTLHLTVEDNGYGLGVACADDDFGPPRS